MAPFNRERAAQILVEAAHQGDAETARKNGITDRTLRNWRRRLQTDPNFSALFQQKVLALEGDWAERLTGAISAGVSFLQRASFAADPANPEAIHAIAGALKLLNEIELTKKVIDARLAEQNRQHHPAPDPVAPAHRASNHNRR